MVKNECKGQRPYFQTPKKCHRNDFLLQAHFSAPHGIKKETVKRSDNEPGRGFVVRTLKQNSRQAIKGFFVFYISRKKYSAFNPAQTCPLAQPVQNIISAPEGCLNFTLK